MTFSYERILPGQVGQVLGNGGAAGDYLDRLIITVSTAATAAVSIKDGGGNAIPIMPNSPGAGIGRHVVSVGATSKAGPWRVTAGLGSSVVAVGDFSRGNTAEYLSLPGTAGDYASTPDSAAISITGDLDLRIKVAMDDWTPVANQSFFSKFVSVTDDAYLVRMLAGGTLTFRYSSGGVDSGEKQATALTGFTDGTPHWLRVVHDVDNGAAGSDVKFYTSIDGIVWTQLGATVTTGAVVARPDNAAVMLLGEHGPGTTMLAGKIYYAEIRNGIDGTVVAKFDPREGVVAAVAFTSGSGEAWTINQSGTPPAELV